MGRPPSTMEYVREVDTGRHLPQSLKVTKIDSIDLSSRNIHTQRQGRTVPTTKLELIPITDDIVPSIETPRTERVPATAFTRGAIHVDSPPPQDPRTGYGHLRRESENQSPVKRKREPSPRNEDDTRRREVVYLPIREGRPTTYVSQAAADHGVRELLRYEHRPNLANNIVYLPLDENNNPRPLHRDLAGTRYATQSSATQVYLDDPQRYNSQSRDYNSGIKYQYIPLGSVQQGRYPEDSNDSSPRLIPLNDSSNAILTRRPLNVEQHTYRSLIPLDSPLALHNQRRHDEEAARFLSHDVVAPRRSFTEIREQQPYPQGHSQVIDQPLLQ